MAGRRAKVKSKTSPLVVLAVILTLIVIGLAIALAIVWRGQQQPQPQVITMGGQQVTVDESLPQNDRKPEEFTVAEDDTVTYTGQASYGIDVSSHQGEIDWAQVGQSDVEFVIARIGYRGYSAGAMNQDSLFEANYAGAVEQGMKVGVYFFSQAVTPEEAEEEARQTLTWLNGRCKDTVVAYDWEDIPDSPARTDGMTGEQVTACAAAFCRVISQAGYQPMIYCNGMLGYLSYDLTQLEGIPIWYAEYSEHPSYAYEITMWQYTNEGTVPGIEGKTDRNIWFSDQVTAEEIAAMP